MNLYTVTEMRTKSRTLYSINPTEVRLIRRQLGLSVRQAAICAGVAKGTWQYYEQQGISNCVVVEKVRGWGVQRERRLPGWE